MCSGFTVKDDILKFSVYFLHFGMKDNGTATNVISDMPLNLISYKHQKATTPISDKRHKIIFSKDF